MQHPVYPELVLDNHLYMLARGHLADGQLGYDKYQLAAQVDKGQVHLTQKSLTQPRGDGANFHMSDVQGND